MSDDLRLQTLTIQRTEKLITETCCSCGILFAMPVSFHNERYADKRVFYCPNGHHQSYTGKSETEKLKAALDEERRARQRAEQNIAYWSDEAKEQRERADKERNRANGYKGHATRMTKRAKAGVCPCCNRTFQQLARHMASQHPEFTPIDVDQVPQGVSVQ